GPRRHGFSLLPAAALLEARCGKCIIVIWNSSNRILGPHPPLRRKVTMMKANLYVGTAFTAVALAAAYAFVPPGAALAADGASLLAGKVVSSTGEALAGIPVKAHRDNRPITVAVYTDAKGEYSFPAWSDLTPGFYSVAIELPDFERAAQPIVVSEGKVAKVDFTLKSKPLAYEDATASEIVAGLPGTDQQKTLFSQCGNCTPLQGALQAGRTKEDWVKVVKKMAGRAAEQEAPGTYAFGQKQFNMNGDADTRPGAPGGGAHELQFDRQGNVIVGMDNG